MKKMLVACALALAVTAVSQQSASAWCEFKWSAGFNISWKSGDNCRTWYIGRNVYNGPYPGCLDGGGLAGGMFSNYSGYGVASSWQAPAPAYAGYQAPAYTP